MKTDADLESLYKEGFSTNHATGLRFVFDAGRNDASFDAMTKAELVAYLDGKNVARSGKESNAELASLAKVA